jgi:hypothetical protein
LLTNSIAFSGLLGDDAPFVLGFASNVAADHACGGDTSAGRGGVCFGDTAAGSAVEGVGVGGLPYIWPPGLCVVAPNGRGGDQAAGCCGLAFCTGLV